MGISSTLSCNLQAEKESNKVIGSEQAILFEQFTENLKEGDVVEGVVGSCTDFGAFVRLGAGKSFRGVEVGLPCFEVLLLSC